VTTIQIIRKRLDAAEVGGANTRYDDDCDCTQSTPDGGTTWIDNPGIDPRHSPALQLPPLTTSDPRCDAAHSMRVQLEKFINTIVTVATQGAGASAILGVLAVFMPEIAILWLLCTEVMGGLLSIGQSVINAAFTTPIYDQLECIFYCHIDTDGICSAEALAAIEAQIGDDIGGVVQAVMALYLTLTGEVGLTNSGAIASEAGDCSGCDCSTCYTWLFEDADGGWVPYIGRGTWVSTQGWTAVIQGLGGYIEVQYTFPSPIHLDNFSVSYAENCGFDITGSGTWIEYTDGSGDHNISGYVNSCGDPLALNFDVGVDGVTKIAFRMEQNNVTSLVGTRLKQATILGVWTDEPTGGMTC